MSPPQDDAQWPWFETDEAGTVTTCSPAAERLGISAGLAAARACARLAEVSRAVTWRGTPAGGWRCEPAVPDDHSAAASRLVQERSRLHDEVRRRRHLERQLIGVTENERRRISLELHDGLGQHLSGLAYTARSLAQQLTQEQHVHAQEAEWLARLLHDAVGRVRALSRGLWPVSLERQSLDRALAALAQDIEQVYGATVTVVAQDFEAESGQAAHHLFRIAQEAIHNALRHGHARHIEVRLEHLPPQAMLSIVSDGAMMDRRKAETGTGLGLNTMRIRADALGGELTIEPLPAGGVEVCLLWTPTRRHPPRPEPA